MEDSDFLEASYPFITDNLFLIARVNKRTGQQYLVMQKLNKLTRQTEYERQINCIHTAVTTISFQEYSDIQDDPASRRRFLEKTLELRSSEKLKEIVLSIEDKFFAMKSWVAGIAEAGIDALDIQTNIEEYGNLAAPISTALLDFLLNALPRFPLRYIIWIKEKCRFNGKIHEPSFVANLKQLKQYGKNLDEEVVHELLDVDLSRFQPRTIEEIFKCIQWKIKRNAFKPTIELIQHLIETQKEGSPGLSSIIEIVDHLRCEFRQEIGKKIIAKRPNDYAISLLIKKGLGFPTIYYIDQLRDRIKLREVYALIDLLGIRRVADLELYCRTELELYNIKFSPNPKHISVKMMEEYKYNIIIAENGHTVGLILNGENIRRIGDSFGDLVYLRYCVMRLNKITKIPDAITKLRQLRVLNLSWNAISDITEKIGSLRSLQKLNLYQNKLDQIPRTISELKNLEELNLGFNNLKVIPESIGRLQNLQKLELKRNYFERLPAGLQSLDNLQYLGLRLNFILRANLEYAEDSGDQIYIFKQLGSIISL